MKLSTRLLHAGNAHDASANAITTPIYQTSTFIQDDIGVHKGFHYSRLENPTRSALEQTLAVIENGRRAFAFGSGMAAIDAVVSLLKPGEVVLVTEHVYGGSYRLFMKLYQQYQVSFRHVDMRSFSEVEKQITPQTRMLWTETPTNPTLQIIDLRKAAEVAKKHGLISVTDNTFATPFLQRPLELGIDVVAHSASKYLGGHSDVISGAVICNDAALAEKIEFVQTARGGIPGPQDCFLVSRGIKTLRVRMKAHCENARRVAEFLKAHPKVNRVYYPGLKDHPGHNVAQSQMEDFGGMVSFDLKSDSREAAQNFYSKTKIFSLAESLGGVESTMTYPAAMSHYMYSPAEQKRLGITPSLIRLSVGIEDGDDLVDDLKHALE